MSQVFYVQTESEFLEVTYIGGQTFSEALLLAGFFKSQALCAAAGRCGHCKIKFLSPAPAAGDKELDLLGEEKLDQGLRLACQHEAQVGARIYLPAQNEKQAKVFKPKSESSVAIDIGSTAVKWQSLDGDGGKFLNPQLGTGSDIMARIAFALQQPEQRQFLHQALWQEIEPLLGSETVVSGNSAMILSLLDMDLSGLAAAPYHLEYKGGRTVVAGKRVYIPPLLSPFLGADISCGLAYLNFGLKANKFPYVLADMGTNGEFVLALGADRYLLASVPMGPALEGVGLRFGQMAGPEVCSRFVIAPQGITCQDGTEFSAISGTGYISLLTLLLRNGLLDRQGHFLAQDFPPVLRKVSFNFFENQGRQALRLGNNIFIDSLDIEELIKVKAAFNHALSCLLQAAGLEAQELKNIYLAGALGENVHIDDLRTIGFLPELAPATAVGNSALQGALLLLKNEQARVWLEQLTDKCEEIDLLSGEGLTNQYISRMRLEFF